MIKIHAARGKKAQIWVSAVIYLLIISSALVIVLKFGIPVLKEMKDRNSFEKTKDVMISLDEQISDVANSGEGTQRVVTLDIIEGKLMVENDKVIWEYDTENDIIDPRISQLSGNLKITSNSNVETLKESNTYTLSTIVDYVNKQPIVFEAKIKKIGDKDNWQAINTSKLIQNLTYDGVSAPGTFNIYLNDDINTSIGNGYTYIVPDGNNTDLGYATVVAHINSSSASPHIEYDIHITLNSFSDFLVIETKNIKIT